MLYSKTDLDRADQKLQKIALGRYLHKFFNDRDNVKKLKEHEKDFFFSNLELMYSEKRNVDPSLKNRFQSNSEYYSYLEKNSLAERNFDLYSIEEAYNYLFYKLILTYFKNLNFQPPVFGPFGALKKNEIARDKRFINKSLKEWMQSLNSRKGPYFSVIYDEYIRKHKMLKGHYNANLISVKDYRLKIFEIQLVSFHIYYLAKIWFESIRNRYHSFTICGLLFIFDIYSFVHILSRHYMPSVNDFDLEKSFNSELPFISIRALPHSFEDVLRLYSFHNPIFMDDQYIIFQYIDDLYIIWFDWRPLPTLGIKTSVMHVRTFYKIEGQHDIKKIIGLKKVKCKRGISFFV